MSGHVTSAVRQIVHDRSLRTCEVCGVARATEVHHRLPRGRSGDNSIHQAGNLLDLCYECHHVRIHEHPEVARANGWLLSPGDDPAGVPALLATPYGQGMFLLDDEGLLSFAGDFDSTGNYAGTLGATNVLRRDSDAAPSEIIRRDLRDEPDSACQSTRDPMPGGR